MKIIILLAALFVSNVHAKDFFKRTFFEFSSITTSTNSSEVDVDNFDGFAVDCAWSGSLTGAIALQASASCKDSEENWIEISNSSVDISTESENLWVVTNPFYQCLRVSIALSSGTMTGQCLINGKGL